MAAPSILPARDGLLGGLVGSVFDVALGPLSLPLGFGLLVTRDRALDFLRLASGLITQASHAVDLLLRECHFSTRQIMEKHEVCQAMDTCRGTHFVDWQRGHLGAPIVSQKRPSLV